MLYLPIQAPVYCGIVHFVDEDYQVFDSSCFGQHGMLTGLTALFKACLKLTFSGRDNLARQDFFLKRKKELIPLKRDWKSLQNIQWKEKKHLDWEADR